MVQYSLDSIVREYLIESGDPNMNRYARIFQIAVAGIRELNMDSSGGVTTIELTVSDSDAANLPNDFVSLIRVAICDGSGQLKALGRNDNMCLPRSYDVCGNDASCGNADIVDSFGVYFNGLEGYTDNYRNGECVGRMFGIGGGGNIYGSYCIDFDRGTINFGGLLDTGCVVLEYLSNLSQVNGQYQVHPFIIEALKSWIRWKVVESKGNNISADQNAERKFYLTEKQAKRRFNNTDIQTWLQAFRSGNKAAPKF